MLNTVLSGLRRQCGVALQQSSRIASAQGHRHFATNRSDPIKLAQDVLSGHRGALSRAITLVESLKKEHRAKAGVLLETILKEEKAEAKTRQGDGESVPRRRESFRIAISGPPGVGKSTFIEAFGTHLTKRGHRIAVLAIDPSSQRTGGSILGDKTRMSDLARNEAAYVRPTPAGKTLGGVARHTSDTMLLCEAAGFDVVLIETVGVGQSETAVRNMTDLFLLLVNPSGGDELQGIKRGIMELADVVVVNKADGHLLPAARNTAAEYKRALTLMRPLSPNWSCQTALVSSHNEDGLDSLLDTVQEYRTVIEESGEKHERRAEQRKQWMWNEITAQLLARLGDDAHVQEVLPKIEGQVANNEIAFGTAADQVLDTFLCTGDHTHS